MMIDDLSDKIEIINVEENDVFRVLVNELMYNSNLTNFAEIFRDIKVYDIHTLIDRPNGTLMKKHKTIDFLFHDGSLIRFSPDGGQGLELTRIQVSDNNYGMGIGTTIMELLLDEMFYKMLGNYTPTITAECVGSTGVGDTYTSIGLESQVRFFRKFGFEVIERHPEYALLERPERGSRKHLDSALKKTSFEG